MAAALLTIPVLTGCYDDKGNYDYISDEEAMPVKIASLESITAKANQELNITPTLSGTESGNYDYVWYTIANEYPYEADTLSHDRDLKADLALKVGKYKLYYRVTNQKNGVYTSVNTPLTVTATDITSGWYVMKQTGRGVDFDYFSLSGTSDKKDFLTAVLGIDGMKGNPIGMMYQASGYGHETINPDGTTTTESNRTALHIVTNQDYITLNGSDLSVLNELKDQSYDMPEKIDFSYIGQEDYQQILINNGKKHALGSIGKWGYQEAGDYDLYPEVIYAGFDDVVFDRKSHSFYDVGPWASGLEACPDMSTGMAFSEFADKNLQLNRLVVHVNNNYTPDCFVLMHDPAENKDYVVNVGFFSNYVYNVTYYDVPASCKLFDAQVMAAPQSASVIYFADGNKLYMYRVATGDVREMKQFAQDENIAFIQNITGKEADGTAFDDVVVITNTASDYNVYRFPTIGSAGELNTNVQPCMSGTGLASKLMFRQE